MRTTPGQAACELYHSTRGGSTAEEVGARWDAIATAAIEASPEVQRLRRIEAACCAYETSTQAELEATRGQMDQAGDDPKVLRELADEAGYLGTTLSDIRQILKAGQS